MPTKEQIAQYFTQGYFIAADAVEPDILDELEAAGRRIRDKVRSGTVNIRSNLGENNEPIVIWGLIAPEYGEPIFAQYMASKPVESYVHAFLGKELRLDFTAFFATANQAPYDTGWHRDVGPDNRENSEEAEMEILNRPIKSRKWHLALVDDPCLLVVPGSQQRYRTEEEHKCLTDTQHADMSTQQIIEVKRGQTVYWNGNIVHRGRAPEGLKERLTLASGLVKYDPNEPMETGEDDRYSWCMADNIRPTLPAKMKIYYDRWRALQPA